MRKTEDWREAKCIKVPRYLPARYHGATGPTLAASMLPTYLPPYSLLALSQLYYLTTSPMWPADVEAARYHALDIPRLKHASALQYEASTVHLTFLEAGQGRGPGGVLILHFRSTVRPSPPLSCDPFKERQRDQVNDLYCCSFDGLLQYGSPTERLRKCNCEKVDSVTIPGQRGTPEMRMDRIVTGLPMAWHPQLIVASHCTDEAKKRWLGSSLSSDTEHKIETRASCLVSVVVEVPPSFRGPTAFRQQHHDGPRPSVYALINAGISTYFDRDL
ncbi:hypothetical protein CHU98_g4546 [Xylaria longipes]|nr:hypothetical protein CHU98_g4546 [Xylaria longipes]